MYFYHMVVFHKKNYFILLLQKDTCQSSLMVQWLRLRDSTPNAGGTGSIPGVPTECCRNQDFLEDSAQF